MNETMKIMEEKNNNRNENGGCAILVIVAILLLVGFIFVWAKGPLGGGTLALLTIGFVVLLMIGIGTLDSFK